MEGLGFYLKIASIHLGPDGTRSVQRSAVVGGFRTGSGVWDTDLERSTSAWAQVKFGLRV